MAQRDWARHYQRLRLRQQRAQAEGQHRPDPADREQPATAQQSDTDQEDDRD
jgi:hypothetical protein